MSGTCRRRGTALPKVDLMVHVRENWLEQAETPEGNVLQDDAFFHGVNLLRCGSGLHHSARRQRQPRRHRPNCG